MISPEKKGWPYKPDFFKVKWISIRINGSFGDAMNHFGVHKTEVNNLFRTAKTNSIPETYGECYGHRSIGQHLHSGI